jgi:hypothetical protein
MQDCVHDVQSNQDRLCLLVLEVDPFLPPIADQSA